MQIPFSELHTGDYVQLEKSNGSTHVLRIAEKTHFALLIEPLQTVTGTFEEAKAAGDEFRRLFPSEIVHHQNQRFDVPAHNGWGGVKTVFDHAGIFDLHNCYYFESVYAGKNKTKDWRRHTDTVLWVITETNGYGWRIEKDGRLTRPHKKNQQYGIRPSILLKDSGASLVAVSGSGTVSNPYCLQTEVL